MRPRIYPSNKCERCGLRYPMHLDECDICKDLDDAEVEMLKYRHRKQLKEAGRLGKYFLFLAVLIFLIVTGFTGA